MKTLIFKQFKLIKKMKHDESTDVYRLKRVGCSIRNEASATGTVKCIYVPKNKLGIKSLGRIDYLVNYCGYRVYYTNNTVYITDNDKKSVRDIKKQKKAPKLTDKTKSTKKKK